MPAGRSGWEFGTSEDPKTKAQVDFEKRRQGVALAFLAQLLGERGGEELMLFRDCVLVFDKPGVLPRLAAGAQNFIPVIFTREVELELAPFAQSMHSIALASSLKIATSRLRFFA